MSLVYLDLKQKLAPNYKKKQQYLSPIFLVSGASYDASYKASFVSVVCN